MEQFIERLKQETNNMEITILIDEDGYEITVCDKNRSDEGEIAYGVADTFEKALWYATSSIDGFLKTNKEYDESVSCVPCPE